MLTQESLNAWDDLNVRIDVLVERLKVHGMQIGDAARAGDTEAIVVIRSYQMLYDRPDPLALILTENALNDWLRKQK